MLLDYSHVDTVFEQVSDFEVRLSLLKQGSSEKNLSDCLFRVYENYFSSPKMEVS